MTRTDLRIRFLQKIGIAVSDCTPDEWLQLALDADAALKNCGPADPAHAYFFNRARHCFEAAEIAEAMSHVKQFGDARHVQLRQRRPERHVGKQAKGKEAAQVLRVPWLD